MSGGERKYSYNNISYISLISDEGDRALMWLNGRNGGNWDKPVLDEDEL